MAITLENSFYVYLLLDPTNFYAPFYVGKGLGRRMSHLNAKHRGENPRKDAKIDKIRAAGHEPVAMKWASGLSESEAYDLEATLILRFGRRGIDENGILVNLCVDARPPRRYGPMPEEQRRKISEANLGRKWSEESRKRASEARRGKKRGRPSPETIEKIRSSNLGKTKKKWSEEAKNRHKEILRSAWASQTNMERAVFSQKVRNSWEKRREKYGPTGRPPKQV